MRTRSVSNMLLGAVLLSAVALSAQAKPPHDRGHGHDRNDHHGQDRGHDAPRYAGMHDRGRHEGWYKKGAICRATTATTAMSSSTGVAIACASRRAAITGCVATTAIFCSSRSRAV